MNRRAEPLAPRGATVVRAIAGAGALVAASGIGRAEEMNYNAFPIGARAALYSGAMIGGVRDSSSVFYNPGALAFTKSSDLGLSGNLITYTHSRINDLPARGSDVSSDQFAVNGTLVSLAFPVDDSITVGFGVAQRQDSSHRYRDTVDRAVATPPGNGFLGELDDERKAKEIWLITDFSAKIDPTLAIGFAPTIAYRGQSRSSRTFSVLDDTSVSPTDTLRSENTFGEVDFYSVSAMLRLGLAWEPAEKVKLGATVGTPSLSFLSSARVTADYSRASELGSEGDLNGRNEQRGLSATFKHPLSLGVGAHFGPLDDFSIAISLEWFAPIAKHRVVKVDADQGFLRGEPDDLEEGTKFLDVHDERDSVINVAIGGEWKFSETLSFYLGFSTNFSPVDLGAAADLLAPTGNRPWKGIPISVEDVDVYSFTLGFGRKTDKSQIAFSTSLNVGSGNTLSRIDYGSDATATTGGFEPATTYREVQRFGVGIAFGFSVFF